MSETGIETRLVYGFLDAGKTTYIRDCIRNDYFYLRKWILFPGIIYCFNAVCCFSSSRRSGKNLYAQ